MLSRKQSFAEEETLGSLKPKLEQVFMQPNQQEQAFSLAKQWFKFGGNPNEFLGGDQPLLLISVLRSYHNVSHLITSKGGDVNRARNSDKLTPLMGSSYLGNLAITKCFLDKKELK